jgi:phosphoglycolate phosphatase
MQHFLLFDIDATLITTGGAGMKSMNEAGRELFGEGFRSDGINFAGRLDPLILSEMFHASGVPHTPENAREFRRVYAVKLRERLRDRAACRTLPGVDALLEAAFAADGVACGLLTGNWEETGSMKLRTCGVEPDRFAVRVWGDDSPHHPPAREHLPGVALERFRRRFERDIDPLRVTVIGDTPHDVSCAKAHGCRSLAVATGSFSTAQLRDAGADRVQESLGDTQETLAWLTSTIV